MLHGFKAIWLFLFSLIMWKLMIFFLHLLWLYSHIYLYEARNSIALWNKQVGVMKFNLYIWRIAPTLQQHGLITTQQVASVYITILRESQKLNFYSYYVLVIPRIKGCSLHCLPIFIRYFYTNTCIWLI